MKKELFKINLYEEYKISKRNDLSIFLFAKRQINKIKNRLMYIATRLCNGNNRELAYTIQNFRVSKKMSKKLHNELVKEPQRFNNNEKMPKIIWWSLLQGEDKMPELAKVCLNSLRRNLSDYDIKIVTLENYTEFVDIPKVIVDKFNAGWISGAHFSDILRLQLLAKHGGIWIDSTVYCTDGKLIENIIDNDMFVYKSLLSVDSNIMALSNWFIASKKGNPYIVESANVLTKYYSDYISVDSYYICHIIMTLLSKKYHNMWDNIPTYNNVNPHMLQMHLDKKFSNKQFELIKEQSSFHKLTRHIDLSNSEYYQYIKNIEGID